ncbi:hypothetical protein ACIQH0_32710 [Streptomyces griseus]|uniref:hypothetical protein n=1 Tax=Streptomyces griseus TaxID=1911 RepID=UPI00382E392F
MPTSNQPHLASESPRQDKRLTGLHILAIVVLPPVLFAQIVLAVEFGDDLANAIRDGSPIAQALVFGGGLSVMWLASLLADSTDPEEGESRQRLTQAESALTDALRGSLAHQPHDSLPDLQRSEGSEASDGNRPLRQRLLGLAELWEATHARLDLYHHIATGQAKTSFRNAQFAMGAGFLLLVVFAGIAFWASTTAVAIVAGGLGAVSAALAGYVAKTFIRSQESAATHLRSYFDQPLELSRYLAAERLVADGDLSQEQRGEILSALVQAMVAGPQPPAPAQPVVLASVPGQPGA